MGTLPRLLCRMTGAHPQNALAKRHVATQSLHAELLDVKAERILLQAEADGDDEDDGSGARDLSTEEVEFDSVFAVPRHHNSVSRPGEDPSTFEQATPNAVALPPSARAETTRLRATLEAARTQLKEVRVGVICMASIGCLISGVFLPCPAYLAHEADAEHAALLEKKTTVERDLARQTEEERTLTAQLAAETDAKAQLTADIDTARIAAEETAERGSIAGSEASDVDFDGVFQSNEAESFEDEAPTVGVQLQLHDARAAEAHAF